MQVLNPKHTVRPNKKSRPLNSSINDYLSYARTIYFVATVPSHLLLAICYPHSPTHHYSLGSFKSFARCHTRLCGTYRECSHYSECRVNIDDNLLVHDQFSRKKVLIPDSKKTPRTQLCTAYIKDNFVSQTW